MFCVTIDINEGGIKVYHEVVACSRVTVYSCCNIHCVSKKFTFLFLRLLDQVLTDFNNIS